MSSPHFGRAVRLLRTFPAVDHDLEKGLTPTVQSTLGFPGPEPDATTPTPDPKRDTGLDPTPGPVLVPDPEKKPA